MTTNERHENIAKHLDRLVEHEILRGWQCVGDRPGSAWYVEGFHFSTRGFSTAQVEAFILGAREAWDAARIAVDGDSIPALSDPARVVAA